MTLQELRYFCVTAEVLHYTRASRLLYISQPSLSYAISKLEQELGVPLFKKNGKKVTLTKYGEEFLPYAKRALAELSEGTERLREMKVPTSGGISLGYIYSVSFSALPEFVNSFYRHHDRCCHRFRIERRDIGDIAIGLNQVDIGVLIYGNQSVGLFAPTNQFDVGVRKTVCFVKGGNTLVFLVVHIEPIAGSDKDIIARSIDLFYVIIGEIVFPRSNLRERKCGR